VCGGNGYSAAGHRCSECDGTGEVQHVLEQPGPKTVTAIIALLAQVRWAGNTGDDKWTCN